MYLHKELETLTRPEIEKLQLERLQKTVRHCMNSPFYKQQSAFTHPVEQLEIPLSFCIPKKTLTNGLMQWPVVFIW